MAREREYYKQSDLRQKLVNLLYLIFITLAFLYLPADFVDSTKYIRRSLDQLNADYENKVKERLGTLEEQLFMNTTLSHDYYAVMSVVKSIDSTKQFIDKLSASLTENVGGYNEYDYIKKSKNFLTSDNIVMNQGQAAELKQRLDNIKQQIRSESLIQYATFIDTLLPTDINMFSSSGKLKTWEGFFFRKTPVAIVLTNLSKIKSDLSYTQHTLVEYLANNLSKVKTDKNMSILSSNSIIIENILNNNYLIGERISFRIVILDSTKQIVGVKAFLKQGARVKELKVSKNGVVSFVANDIGRYKLVIEDGTNPPIEHEITIVNPRSAFSEKSEPEVLYLGIDNPIVLSGSGFKDEELQLELSKGEVLRFRETYYLRFTEEGLVSLQVYAVNPDGRFKVSEKTFVVKPLPDPIVKVGGREGGYISDKLIHVVDKLTAEHSLIKETGVYDVVGFDLVRVSLLGKESASNRGPAFSGESQRLVRKLVAGDLLVIDNIKIKATDGTIKTSAPVVFSIK